MSFSLQVTLKVPTEKDMTFACDCPDAACAADCIDSVVGSLSSTLTNLLRATPPPSTKGKRAVIQLTASGDGWSGFDLTETIPDAVPEVVQALKDSLNLCCGADPVKKYLKP